MSAFDPTAPDAALQALGLHADPFGPEVDEAALFLDPERAQRLDMLQHLVQYSDLLLVVTGTAGSGKTTLLQHFVTGLGDSGASYVLTATPGMSTAELMQAIALGFEVIEDASDINVPDDLHVPLAGVPRSGLAPILIVDDAHLLPADTLRALFELSTTKDDDDSLLRTILFCEPSMEDVLASPELDALGDSVTHTLDLPLLTEEQTAEYLEHRLAAARLEQESPFTEQHLRKIHRHAQGNPGLINQVAGQILLSLAPQPPAKPGLFRQVPLVYRLAVLFGAVALGGVLYWQEDINEALSGGTADSGQVSEHLGDRAQLPLALPQLAAERDRVTNADLDPDLLRPYADDAVLGGDGEPSQAAEPAAADPDAVADAPAVASGDPAPRQDEPPLIPIEDILAFGDDLAAGRAPAIPAEPAKPAATAASAVPATAPPRLDGLSPDPVPANGQRQDITLRGSGLSPRATVTVRWDGESRTLPADRVTVDGDQARLSIATGIRNNTWSVQVRNPDGQVSNTLEFRVVAPEQPAPAAGTELQTPTGGSEWLRSREPRRYTLQLLAVRTPEAATSFAERHGLSDTTAVVRNQVEGQHWYALLYGDYAGRAQAETAAREIGARLEVTPWPRRFGPLQQALAREAATSREGADTARTGVRSDAWLWGQDPRQYTVQLVGASDEAAVLRTIQEHRLQGEVSYFRTLHDGRDWYVLVSGVYADRAAAQRAADALPAGLRANQPWVRSFASVHADLSKVE